MAARPRGLLAVRGRGVLRCSDWGADSSVVVSFRLDSPRLSHAPFYRAAPGQAVEAVQAVVHAEWRGAVGLCARSGLAGRTGRAPRTLAGLEPCRATPHAPRPAEPFGPSDVVCVVFHTVFRPARAPPSTCMRRPYSNRVCRGHCRDPLRDGLRVKPRRMGQRPSLNPRKFLYCSLPCTYTGTNSNKT